MMDGIFLLLGTNLGNRKSNLKKAVDFLEASGIIAKRLSSIFQSAPWGISDQPFFLNQAILVETSFSPAELLFQVKNIEKQMGRSTTNRWGERLIDIDILYYNSIILQDDQLTVPHPEIQNRKFTLMPMAELAPHFYHPTLKLNQQELLNICTDNLEVVKL